MNRDIVARNMREFGTYMVSSYDAHAGLGDSVRDAAAEFLRSGGSRWAIVNVHGDGRTVMDTREHSPRQLRNMHPLVHSDVVLSDLLGSIGRSRSTSSEKDASMNRMTVAAELVKAVRDLQAADESRSKVAGDFSLVISGLNGLKMSYVQTSDEAIFLGIVRDMAVNIAKGNMSRVRSLASELVEEMKDVKRAADESRARVAGSSLLEQVLSDTEVAKLDGVVDEQTYDLAVEVYRRLRKDFELSSAQNEALNRLKQSCDRSGWGVDMHRNNIFKAAHALGIPLPSSMF